MKTALHTPLPLLIGIGLLMSALSIAANAQQPTQPTQQQQQEAKKEMQQEERNRQVEVVKRHISDDERGQAMTERKRWLQQRERSPVIGVLLSPDEHVGANIAGVTPGSAAAMAGLQAGDRITSIDGHRLLGSSGELRVANARKLLGKLDTQTPVQIAYLRKNRSAVATVTPRLGERVMMLSNGGGDARVEKHVRINKDGNHAFLDDLAPHVASEIHEEIVRLGPGSKCKGAHCKTPRLLSAFRWNGLNLASLDPQLGRYFGTDKGVLVLSVGELDGLQSGDVIQSVDGRQVDSPREVMDALRDKPANARVAVGYLRDRKTGRTNVTVPEMMRDIPLAPPPPPPRPPAAPKAPAPPALPAPPAPPPPAANIAVPPAPPAPPVFDARQMSCAREGAREICMLPSNETASWS